MDLVTVTCARDFDQMVLQAESINKFVEPCTHWVIVNDILVDKELWTSVLTPYYTKHTLKLLFPDWNTFNHYSGYVKQQLYKFWISKYLTDDYLILDSKNFFIAHTNIEEWRNIVGCGIPEIFYRESSIWKDTVECYKEHINYDCNMSDQTAIQTPFVFKISVIKNIHNLNKFLNWFANTDVLPSEFLYYSMLLDKYGVSKLSNIRKSFTFFTDITDKIYDITLSNDIKVLGLHRDYLKMLNQQEINKINDWLKNKGLTSVI